MNLSRLATLAVFFMMVMSAFVTVPTYNVGADDHEGSDDDNGDEHNHEDDGGDEHHHEHPEGPYCYDMDSHEMVSDISPEDCREMGYMWVEDDDHHGDNNRGEPNPDHYHAVMTMNSIDNFTIEIQGEFLAERADEMRSQLADMCMMWTGSESGVITNECFEMWLEMIEESSDDYHDDDGMPSPQDLLNMADADGDSLLTFDEFWSVFNQDDSHTDEQNPDFFMGIFDEADMDNDGHLDMMELEIFIQALVNQESDGHHGDEFGCPPDMSDEICEQWEDCDDNRMNMSCMRIIYDYCETSSHCSNDPYETPEDCYDDDGEPCGPNVVYLLFAYEDGSIDAEEFIDSMMDSFNTDNSSAGDHDDHDDCDYGENNDRCRPYENPGLYQMDYITVDVDQEVSISSTFEDRYIPPPTFICGDGTEIAFYHVNNNTVDCEDGADEQWYDSNTPDDTSDDCQEAVDEDCEGDPVNWFDCHDGTQIWIYQVNDWNWDCEDGEDEHRTHYSWNSWNGEIYLLEGEHDYIPGYVDLTPDEVYAFELEYCEWEDTNKTNVVCNDYIRANLGAGEVYTLVTMTDCYEDYEYWWSLECEQFGNYNHKMFYGDGSETSIAGEIYSSPHGFCGNCWDYGEDHSDFVQNSAANFSYDLDTHDYSYSNFYLYNAETFVVGADGFEGYLISSGYTCEETDGFEDCWGSNHEVYLYDTFDITDTFSGIINMSDYDYNQDWDCDVDYCHFQYMNLELDEGDYVIVTTTNGEHNSDTIVNNTIFDTANNSVTSWGDELRNAYYEYDDGEVILVTGDERQYFLGWWNWYINHDDYDDHDDHDDHDDYDEDRYHVMMALMENFTAYEENTYTEVEAAENLAEILYMMEELGMFRDNHDDHHGDHGDHMSLDSFDVSSWDSANDLEQIVNWYNDQYYHHDSHTDMTVDDFLAMCEGISDEVNEEVAQCVLDKALSMMPDHDDHHGDEMWYCEDCNCQDMDDAAGHGEAPEGYRQCGGHEDDHDDHGDHDHGDHDDMGPMVCYDMGEHVLTEDDNAEDCRSKGFMWVPCSSGPPGTCDGLEGDDGGNPPLLDGIVGVGGEDVEPVFMSTNIVGSVSENQGLPIYNGNSFFLTFEGADDSLDVHEAYIPVGEDGNLWHVEMVLLEDYEVISCDLCEDLEIEANGAKFNSNEPVTVRFGKVAEPLPDCDVVVTLSADGYAFEPAEVSINVGETVCWQWKDSTDVHNVVSVIDFEDYASSGGFSSGEPSNTVDFRHTFTEDNATYYYACEPHATMGMVGKVTVGEGATEDPVEDILDESEVPSIGFVVGSLVLVGAAGLRRRIH